MLAFENVPFLSPFIIIFFVFVFYLWVHSSGPQTLASINVAWRIYPKIAACWVPSPACLVSDFPSITASDSVDWGRGPGISISHKFSTAHAAGPSHTLKTPGLQY